MPGEEVLLGYLDSNGLHLSEESMVFEPGDHLVLSAAGLVDVSSSESQGFKRQGLTDMLSGFAPLSADKLCSAIFNALSDCQGTAK